MSWLKKIFGEPYTYVFLLSYYGVWLIWNDIKIPFTNPEGVISYLPSIHYNPTDNVLRFVLSILVPPLACLLFWWTTNGRLWKKYAGRRSLRRFGAGLLVSACLVLALAMGIVEGSTNPANNPPDTYGGPYSHALVDTFHEGETLGPAISYEQPDLKPYKNFVIVHGVFQDPLRTVIAFKLFGKSIGAARAFAVILVMITFVLYYVLLVVLFRGNLIKSAAGLVGLGLLLIPSGTLPFIQNLFLGIQLPFRDIATIAFLIFAVLGLRYRETNRTRRLALVSFLIGFVMVAGYANSIDRAFYITALSGLWLIMILLMAPWRTFWRTSLLPFIVGSVVGLPVLGLALKWDFVDFARYLLTIGHYKEYLDGEIFPQPDLSVSAILMGLGACLTIGLFWVVRRYTSARTEGKTANRKIRLGLKILAEAVSKYHTYILLFVTGLIFLRSAVGRADLGHFNYSVQWLYLFLVYVLVVYAFSIKKYRQALSFLTILLFGFILVYFAGLVKRTDIRNDTFPIHVSDTAFVRPDYLQTAGYLQKNLHGQDSFVTLTSEGTWYYLVGKPSPINYPIIWYAFTAPQRQGIANEIQGDAHIKYIITNNNWTTDFDFVPNPVRFPEVYKVFYQNYMPKVGFGQQTIWERK